MSILADRLGKIKPSATLAVTQKAAELKAEGHDIIGLGAGEPDFDTPLHICNAAKKAIDNGETRYTAVAGTLKLRQAICDKFKRENHMDFTPEQITVGCGGKQTIYNAMVATLNEGDEVLIPAPYWVSYPDITLLCGGNPVIINTKEENRFKLQPQELEQYITAKSKWLILNSPSNPTGIGYTKDDLLAIAEVVRKHEHLWVMVDDIYEHLIYGDYKFYSLLEVAPDLANRTLTLNGVSKAFAMTGWRVGYAAGPVEVIKAMNKVQSQSSTHTSSVSQAAALAALSEPMDFIEEWKVAFWQRANLIVELVNQAQGLSVTLPDGAFYIYPSCKGVIGKKTPSGKIIADDLDFAAYLLEEEKVAVVPGSAFGLSPYFRISYATSAENLQKAGERIIKACAKLV